MVVTDAQMTKAARLVLLPIILILSFGLFQYLAVMYYSRRRELRGMLLLFTALLGFAVLVPLAHPSDEVVHHLNDISEACSTLTFLIQITIIGRDSNKKVKIRTLYVLTLATEVLIAVEIAVIVFDTIEVFDASVGASVSNKLNQAVEDISLVFIFVFRFYYISLIHGGVRSMLKTRRLELFVYALFVTHEYPFLVLEAATHVSWEYVQGIYHRMLVAWCLWLTIQDKLQRGRGFSFTSRATSGALTSMKSVGGGATESARSARSTREAGPMKGPTPLSLASVVPHATVNIAK